MATKRPLRYQKIAIVYNADKDRAQVEARRLREWLKQHQSQPIQIASKVTSDMRECDVIVALGGDGTVLRAARQASKWMKPVLGVNVGQLGFLAATEAGGMYRTLTRILNGQGRIEKRTMVSATAFVSGKKIGPFSALNDCVIRTGPTGHVVNLWASVQGRLLASYRGDGLIAASPTGSTAYSLAASGPIVHPELDVLILSPICPHSLTQRPLVIPNNEVVEVEIRKPSPSVILCIDGDVTHALHPGDRVEFKRGNEQVLLLMDPGRNFYQVLQSKLKWGAV